MPRTAGNAILAAVAGAVAAFAAGAVGIAGCGAEPDAPSPAPSSQAAAGMPAIERGFESFDGVAAEVLQVPGYTYVAVRTAAGDVRWTASLKKTVEPGARVHVRSFGAQREFKSPRLGRVFSKLWFAAVTVTPNEGGPP